MAIRVRAVGQRGDGVGKVAGFYDPSCKHPNPELRGGQGRRVRVGDIFEINDMSEFSDSEKTLGHGKRGWMELLEKPTAIPAADAQPVTVPGQVPGTAIKRKPGRAASGAANTGDQTVI